MPIVLAPAVPWIIGGIAAAGAYIAGQRLAEANVRRPRWNTPPPLPVPRPQSSEMRRADEQANDRLREGTSADTCTGDCEENENPCKHLERGSGTGPYRGGAHGQTKLPYGDGLESHHTPAASASPLPYDKGPAIQMDPMDHRKTSSWGSYPENRAYVANQQQMLGSGQFMGAIMLDYADVQRIAIEAGQPGKYDEALTEMLAYAECLKRTGQAP